MYRPEVDEVRADESRISDQLSVWCEEEIASAKIERRDRTDFKEPENDASGPTRGKFQRNKSEMSSTLESSSPHSWIRSSLNWVETCPNQTPNLLLSNVQLKKAVVGFHDHFDQL